MFEYCSSLEIAPELLAETIYPEGYRGMFLSCSSLRYIKMLGIYISTGALTNWVANVPTSDGVFVKHANQTGLTRGISGIPINWVVEDYIP
jgi:hypothetical protein